MWQLEAQLKTCQRAFTANEKIITGLKQNIAALYILHNQASTAQIYNAAGKKKTYLGEHSLRLNKSLQAID